MLHLPHCIQESARILGGAVANSAFFTGFTHTVLPMIACGMLSSFGCKQHNKFHNVFRAKTKLIASTNRHKMNSHRAETPKPPDSTWQGLYRLQTLLVFVSMHPGLEETGQFQALVKRFANALASPPRLHTSGWISTAISKPGAAQSCNMEVNSRGK